jgi:glycine cleavage system H protein
MNLKELKYTKDHEWVKLKGEEAVIGITDHAQSELGDITFIDLPRPGQKVKQSDGIATIESVKAASEIYSPVSGEVLSINETLIDAPETVNTSPYEDGWICKISVAGVKEPDGLMDHAEYEEYLRESKNK